MLETVTKEFLNSYGLNQEEAERFVELVQKMNIPEDEIQAFEDQFDLPTPFEGGICVSEALIALKTS